MIVVFPDHTHLLFGIVHCTYLGVSGYNFQKNIVLFCLKIFFTLTNSVDPNEMPHHAVFHLGLHYLKNYPFKGFFHANG